MMFDELYDLRMENHKDTIQDRLYPNSKSHRTKKVKFQYGRFGTPTSETFCNAIADLYDADGSIVTPSGLAAAVIGILSFVKKGSHLLVTDSAYGSTRNFISKFLPTIGVEVEFYNPRIKPKDFEKLIKENTSLVYLGRLVKQTISKASLLIFSMEHYPVLKNM